MACSNLEVYYTFLVEARTQVEATAVFFTACVPADPMRRPISSARFESTHAFVRTPASRFVFRRTFTESVLESAWEVLQVLHASGSGGLSSDGFGAPVVLAYFGAREPARRARLLLDVEATFSAPPTEGVGFVVPFPCGSDPSHRRVFVSFFVPFHPSALYLSHPAFLFRFDRSHARITRIFRPSSVPNPSSTSASVSLRHPSFSPFFRGPLSSTTSFSFASTYRRIQFPFRSFPSRLCVRLAAQSCDANALRRPPVDTAHRSTAATPVRWIRNP